RLNLLCPSLLNSEQRHVHLVPKIRGPAQGLQFRQASPVLRVEEDEHWSSLQVLDPKLTATLGRVARDRAFTHHRHLDAIERNVCPSAGHMGGGPRRDWVVASRGRLA